MPTGLFGLGPLGSIPLGSSTDPFGVAGAASESAVVVRVVFNELLDISNPALASPASYVTVPPVTVHSVSVVSANTVRLLVDYLSNPSYALTVSGVTNYWGQALDPALDTATFYGYASDSRFDAVPVSRTKVRLLFESTMLENAALTDPASYSVTDLSGTPRGIASVEAEGPPGARVAVALVLSDEITPGIVYTARVLTPDVKSSLGFPVTPGYDDFQYIEQATQVSIPYEWFGGVAEGGLLGEHGGLAFFSPALEAAATDSVLQVDQVSVCTRAYDSYVWPTRPDPAVFFLWAAGKPMCPLDGRSVLFATHYRLGEIHTALSDRRADDLPLAEDSRAIATLTEELDPTRVSYLNALEYAPAPLPRAATWPLFDGVTATPFILADNLAPIPPGATTVIVLEP